MGTFKEPSKEELHSLISFFQSADHENAVYLNSSAYGLMPQLVKKAITKYIDYPFVKSHIHDLKKTFANLYQRQSSEVFFTSGAHSFIERLIKILCKDKNSEFLIDPLSHKAIENPINYECAFHGGKSSYLSHNSDGIICINSLKAALHPKVTAVFINQCSNISGLLQNVKEITEVIHQYNKNNNTRILCIVDASQSNSKLALSDHGGDVYFFAQQKSLALPGCSSLITEDAQNFLCDSNDINHSNFILSQVLEAGTPNFISILSIVKATEFYVDLDQGFHIKEFCRFTHIKHLKEYAYGLLKETPKLRFLGVNDKNLDNNLGILTFFIEGVDLVQVGKELSTFGIHVEATSLNQLGNYFCVPNAKNLYPCLNEKQSTLRISIQWYNTKNDIDRFFKFFKRYL
ncbi:MAG: aminotransferase class V-fold PLP-dependent enzyme [Candidatus Cloacimonetes bacterium]|nr:aminotransferase class V-fold PLP-dependent enzyme [Candidatus Cloacimonadota bacterium]